MLSIRVASVVVSLLDFHRGKGGGMSRCDYTISIKSCTKISFFVSISCAFISRFRILKVGRAHKIERFLGKKCATFNASNFSCQRQFMCYLCGSRNFLLNCSRCALCVRCQYTTVNLNLYNNTYIEEQS